MDESSTKRCGRCQAVKALAEFTPRGKGRQSYCRSCVSEYFRAYYQKHKAAYAARASRSHKKMRELVRNAKCRPCADCGCSYPYYVMDFDHREGESKLCNVADLDIRKRVSIRTLLAELAKCDVVCANCHRIRTHQRRAARRKGAAAQVGPATEALN